MGRKSGIDRLVEELQPDAPCLEGDDAVQRDLALGDQGELFGPVSPVRRGRPKGAVAKSTRDWAEKIVASGASPLEFWARIILRDPVQMASDWGLDAAQVLAYKMQAAQLLAPYVHKRMPVEVSGNMDVRHLLAFGLIEAEDPLDPELGPFIDVDEKGVENQGLTNQPAEQSDAEASDESASD